MSEASKNAFIAATQAVVDEMVTSSVQKMLIYLTPEEVKQWLKEQGLEPRELGRPVSDDDE